MQDARAMFAGFPEGSLYGVLHLKQEYPMVYPLPSDPGSLLASAMQSKCYPIALIAICKTSDGSPGQQFYYVLPPGANVSMEEIENWTLNVFTENGGTHAGGGARTDFVASRQ